MLNLNLKITDKEKIVRGRRDSDAKAIPLNFENIDKDEETGQLFSEKRLISTLLKLESNSGQGFFLTSGNRSSEDNNVAKSYRSNLRAV